MRRRAFPASSSVVLSRCAVSLARACPRPLRFCRLRSGRLVPLLRSQATWLRPRRRRQHGPRRRPRHNSDAASGLLKKRHMRRVSSTPSTRAYWPAHKSNCRGASSPLLNHDLTPSTRQQHTKNAHRPAPRSTRKTHRNHPNAIDATSSWSRPAPPDSLGTDMRETRVAIRYLPKFP